MSKYKFAPGPWVKLKLETPFDYFKVYDDCGKLIAKVSKKADQDAIEQVPALVEMVEWLVNNASQLRTCSKPGCSTCQRNKEMVERANTVLAKVRGEGEIK